MICAVCNVPCRGKCAKCGAALCATHKPTSTRAKCACCPRRSASTPGVQPYAAPMTRASLLTAPLSAPLAGLALSDQLTWIAERRARLQQKQNRERAYLNRRAARGTHTPTDDAYEADQVLENDLLAALNLLESCLQGDITPAGSASANTTYAGDTSFLFPDPGLHEKLEP